MLLKKSKVQSPKSKGFTLIELLVASSIFIIVMVIAIGAVLAIVDANRKAQSINSVMTNLNFALDSISREIREGVDYSTSISFSDCDLGASLSFTNNNGQPVEYCWDSTDDPDFGKSILKFTQDENGAWRDPLPITAVGEVKITDMEINIDDTDQPNVFIHIQGLAGANAKTQSTFNIQTLLTQTALNQ